MAISSLDQFVAACTSTTTPLWDYRWCKTYATSSGSPLLGNSFWTLAGMPAAGAAPTTLNGVTLNSSTVGAMPLPTIGTGNTLYVSGLTAYCQSGSFMFVWLYDRLWHNTFSLSVTSNQAITFPTLPRYTFGELWMECYGATGSTSVTYTITYTNQSGTANQTTSVTPPTSMGAYKFWPVPLAAGDTGVQAVTGITLSATTTGTLGLTIGRRLCGATTALPGDAFTLGWPQVQPGACLALMGQVESGGTNLPVTYGTLLLVQG